MEFRSSRRTPPNYGSRAMQWRLMLLVGALMIVLVMMDEARKPENWEWMGFRKADSENPSAAEDESRRVSPRLVDLFRPMDNANSLFQAMAEESLAAESDDQLAEASDDEPTDALNGVSGEAEAAIDSGSQIAIQQGTRRRILTPLFQSLDNEQRWALTQAIELLSRGERWDSASAEARQALAGRVRTITQIVVNRLLEEARQTAAAALPPSDTAVDLAQVKTPWDELLAQMQHQFELLSESIAAGAIADDATVGDMTELADLAMAWDRVLLEQVEDLSIGLRKNEQTLWYQMSSKLAQWEAAAEKPVATLVSTYDLDQQPDRYRGKWVRIEGEVRRIDRVPVPAEVANIVPAWLLWIRPASGPDNVISVYVRHLPDSFPRPEPPVLSLDLREAVQVDAVFFKREGYQATDVTRVTPRLIANQIDWAPEPIVEQATREISWQTLAVIIVVNILVATAFAVWVARSTRRRPPSQPPGPIQLPLWLLTLAAWQLAQPNELAAQQLPPWLIEGSEVQSEEPDWQRVLSDFPTSELDRLGDGLPLSTGEPIGFELLERMRSVGPIKFRAAAQTLDRQRRAQIMAKPSEHRLQVLRCQGRLQSVEILELDELTASEFDRESVYRIVIGEANSKETLETSDSQAANAQDSEQQDRKLDGGEIVAWIDAIPPSWLEGVPVGDRVEVVGLFLKLEQVETGSNQPPVPLLIGRSLAWIEPDSSPRSQWTELGFDRGQWDLVEQLEQSELKAADGPTLYRLFHAAAQVKDRPIASEPLELFDLLRDGPAHLGQALAFPARIKRISAIGTGEDLYARDAGVDQYFQIDLLVSLQGNEVKLTSETEAATIVNTYPVTVCMTQLPPGLSVAPEMDVPVWVNGVFYRNWRYQSAYVREVDTTLRQVAPLIVAWNVQLTSDGKEGAAMLTTLAAIFCGVALGGTLLIFGYLRWSDGRYRQDVRQVKQQTLPTQLDLANIKLPSAATDSAQVDESQSSSERASANRAAGSEQVSNESGETRST